MGPLGPLGPVAPVFMNLHVKCPIFSAKDHEDGGSHPFHSGDWMKSQRIAEGAKCGRFYLTLSGDAHLWYKSVIPVRNIQNNLQRLFHRQFPNWD